MCNVICLLVCLIPTTLAAVDVGFFLYTPQNPENYTQVGPNNVSTYLIHNLKTYIFIHGLTDSRNSLWYKQLKTSLFSGYNCNIIEVDYSRVAAYVYPIAIVGTVAVGDQIGDFILNLTSSGYALRDIHVVGHSLGGQTAARVGERVLARSGRKLHRITALDPAGPLYEPPRLAPYVLDRNDAEIVFVIHTSTLEGYDLDAGTIDVYPNGGRFQPCQTLFLLGCSHARAWELYAYAVANKNWLFATKCDSYQNFLAKRCLSPVIDIGGDLDFAQSGRYYLTTTAQPPYRVNP